MPAFQLTKWYMDVVTPEGEGMILYHAHLRWSWICLTHTEMLRFHKGGGVCSASSLKRCDPPRSEASRSAAEPDPHLISCDLAHFRFKGTWRTQARGTSLRLWESPPAPKPPGILKKPRGILEWQCLMPAAEAMVQIADTHLNGRGYVERLEMTLPPDQLPMQELRWGRFLSEHGWATWIDWRGGAERTWILDERGLHTTGHITDSVVESDAWAINLPQRRTIIRDAELGSSLRVPALILRPLCSRRLRMTHETKWLTHALMTHGSVSKHAGIQSPGWAIHEVVRFPSLPHGSHPGSHSGSKP